MTSKFKVKYKLNNLYRYCARKNESSQVKLETGEGRIILGMKMTASKSKNQVLWMNYKTYCLVIVIVNMFQPSSRFVYGTTKIFRDYLAIRSYFCEVVFSPNTE